MALTKTTNSMISGASVNVLDFGADPTGVADSLAAFNQALAFGNYVVVPIGTYKVTGTINIVAGKSFVGFGVSGAAGHQERPKIVPTAAVTGCVLEVEGTFNWIQGIFIDGAATSGVVAIRVGNVALANLAHFTHVEANNFYGAGGKCLQIINNVGLTFQYCRFNKAQQCAEIGALATTSGAPTTVQFYNCQFREAVGVGISIARGFQLSFIDCLFEANYQSGMSISTGAGQIVLGVRVIRGWFEDNWRSLVPPARTAEYHLDVNGLVGAIEDIVVDSTFFSLSATSERAIRYQTVYYGRIIAPQIGGVSGTGQISISGGSGFVDEYRALATSTIGPYFSNQLAWADIYSEWTVWTPTIIAFAGTFTSVTVNFARYKLVGKTLFIELQFTGTTDTLSSGLSCSLPNNVIPKCLYLKTPAWVNNVGVPETGYIENGAGDGIYIRRQASSNFGVGANCGVSISATIEIQ